MPRIPSPSLSSSSSSASSSASSSSSSSTLSPFTSLLHPTICGQLFFSLPQLEPGTSQLRSPTPNPVNPTSFAHLSPTSPPKSKAQSPEPRVLLILPSSSSALGQAWILVVSVALVSTDCSSAPMFSDLSAASAAQLLSSRPSPLALPGLGPNPRSPSTE
ncbi:hypothetical protein CSAL01_12363 [Colletotrichum salicis]|uniref:Uncharacterized protein n=1 Tax=Colletotrichum salicis TaxID=1209931 RepID=A0A135T203_9PEZI|nr:hypothetical protein CSAL01_12363 [Colletotrichum salicis]